MALLNFLFGKPPGPSKGQKQITAMQRQAMEQAMPYYAPALSWLAQNAGMGLPAAATGPAGSLTPAPARAGVAGEGQLGIFGQNPADVLRMRQAEEDVNRMAGQRARLLQYRLGQQGLGGSGAMTSALAQNELGALRDLSNFRRQLAIGAGPEQERRMQMLLAALGFGTGLGGQAQGQMGMQQQLAAQSQMGGAQNLLGLGGLLGGIRW